VYGSFIGAVSLPLWGRLCLIPVMWGLLGYVVVALILRATPRIRVLEFGVIVDGIDIHMELLRGLALVLV
jgi:hypothetical protein